MRQKRILCLLMLAMLLLFRCVPLQQVHDDGLLPTAPSAPRVSACDQVSPSLGLWAGDDHHRLFDGYAPSLIDLYDLSVGHVRDTIRLSSVYGHRPSVLMFSKCHPYLAPPRAAA